MKSKDQEVKKETEEVKSEKPPRFGASLFFRSLNAFRNKYRGNRNEAESVMPMLAVTPLTALTHLELLYHPDVAKSQGVPGKHEGEWERRDHARGSVEMCATIEPESSPINFNKADKCLTFTVLDKFGRPEKKWNFYADRPTIVPVSHAFQLFYVHDRLGELGEWDFPLAPPRDQQRDNSALAGNRIDIYDPSNE